MVIDIMNSKGCQTVFWPLSRLILARSKAYIYRQFDSVSGAVIPRLYLPATDNEESSKNSKRNVARSIAMTP